MLGFHFLRVWWLLALIPIIILVILLLKKFAKANNWARYCDNHLLEHIMDGENSKVKQSFIPLFFMFLWVIAVLALAGPTWKYKDIPIYQKNISRVIALDVSQSMDTSDVSPTRLERAKYKIFDILRKIKEGQVGMIVFSSEPFVVSPLTSDANTIENMITVINSGIVPVQGNNMTKAIKKSAELLFQAGAQEGQIILVTDSTPSAQAIEEAKKIAQEGIEIDVYAIGTPKGAIASNSYGDYIKDGAGNIQYFGVDLSKLQLLAEAGAGELVTLTANNSDISKLLTYVQSNSTKKSNREATNVFWQDEGIYLIWLLVILSSLLFRKGVLERICR